MAELADALDLGSSAFGVGVRLPSSAPLFYLSGCIAQLGEHLPYKQGVTGSSPVVPTIKMKKINTYAGMAQP